MEEDLEGRTEVISLVISGGEVDIQTLSFSPKDLEIGKLRYINEERDISGIRSTIYAGRFRIWIREKQHTVTLES